MKDIQDALARVGKSLAEIAQVVVKAMGDLTPEQRAVIEFLAENPEVAEGLQELNQKLARQRAIGGATKETAQPAEPLIKDEKTRKAVRVWAEINLIEEVIYSVGMDRSACNLTDTGDDEFAIEFVGWIPTLEDGKAYAIDELCGEETHEPLEPSFIDLSERIKEKEEE